MVAINGTYIWELYHWLMVDLPDPRTRDWFLMGSPPYDICPILTFYLVIVVYFGPKWMGKPIDVKIPSLLLNVAQVALGSWVLVLAVPIWYNYNWWCQNVIYGDSEITRRTLLAMYLYLVIKCLQMCDTVLLVLAKRPLTFLHVFHHTITVFWVWAGLKYLPGGHAFFSGLVNLVVHVAMYSHYTMATLRSKYPGHLTVKKTVTGLQVAHFVAMFVHTSFLLVFDCGYPRWYAYVELPCDVLFFCMFSNVYYTMYIKTTTTMTTSKSANRNKINYSGIKYKRN